MIAPSIFLLTTQFWMIFMTLFGSFLLIYVYMKYKRDPALYWGLALLFLSLSVVSELFDLLYIQIFSRALAGGFVLYGTIELLEEERTILSEHFRVLTLIPLVSATYSAFSNIYGYSDEWFVVVGLPYAVSGFIIVLSGFFIFSLLTNTYNHKAKLLGALFMFYGLYQMIHPFTRSISGFSSFNFLIPVFFVAFSIYEMAKFTFSREFITGEIPAVIKVKMEPGFLFVSLERYDELKQLLRDFPVLAFVRDKTLPKTWRSFFITTIHKHSAEILFPTALPLINARVVQYLKEAKEKGTRGIVVFDCLEYLKMYNGFEALAKFLSSLRDYAFLYDGTIVGVLDEKAWDKRELVMLKRLMNPLKS